MSFSRFLVDSISSNKIIIARDNISGLTYLTIGDEPALIERDLAERAIIIVADIVRLNPSLIDNVSHVVRTELIKYLDKDVNFRPT